MSDLYDLTIPGTLPDLLLVTSPICVVRGVLAGRRGVVIASGDTTNERLGYVLVPFVDHPRQRVGVHWTPLAEIALDLTHTTGRHHARLWLGKRWPGQDPQTLPPPFAYYLDVRLAGLAGLPPAVPATPEFADFDPTDTRRLPDGSPWVEADGLRRICLCAHSYAGQSHG